MIYLGIDNTLTIARDTKIGLYLTDGEGNDVLLPNKYVPATFNIGDELVVFVYLDHEERMVATTLEPKIYLNEFALLQVNYTNQFGAFLDWGLEKDLFVPFKEQARLMENDKKYLVYMYLDEKSGRLVASSRISKFLSNDTSSLAEGQEVDLIVSHITDAGINVIINETYKGLVYKSTVFDEIRTGDRLIGYIKTIRPDHKIDVVLEPPGYARIEPHSEKILNALYSNDGFLKLNDASHPDEIKLILKMSKKSFKQAIGLLYKQRLINMTETGIQLHVDK
jgi:predicted RNA-binding protein (virulence factor B family)